jgi:hypothetical protein
VTRSHVWPLTLESSVPTLSDQCATQVDFCSIRRRLDELAASRNYDLKKDLMQAWRVVAWGMRIKLSAIWVLLIVTPAVVAISVLVRLNPNAPEPPSRFGEPLVGWPVAADFVVALLIPLCIDFVGRCLCLAAPVENRMQPVLSVAFQAAGMSGMLLIVSVESLFAGPAILWTIAMQLISASLFSGFLADLCASIELDKLSEEVAALRERVGKTTFAAAGSLLFAMLVAVPLLVLAFFLGRWVSAAGFLVVLMYPAFLMVKSIILYRSIVQSVLLWLVKLGEAQLDIATSTGQDAIGVIEAAIVPETQRAAEPIAMPQPGGSEHARSADTAVLNSVEEQLASLGLLEMDPTEAHRWRLLSLGLLLKEGAIWILLALPLVAIVLRIDSPPLLALFALVPDAVGRLLCSYAPAPNRTDLLVSILAQIVGLTILIAASLFDSYLAIAGILVAVVLQYVAAIFFVRFLRHLAGALGIKVVQSPVLELRERLVALSTHVVLFVGISFALITIAALMTLIAGLLTYGIGFYLGYVAIIPLTFILGPYMLFVLGLSLQMLYFYDTTLRQIRNRLQTIATHERKRRKQQDRRAAD